MTKTESKLDPEICDCLREVLDPEIGLNVVDLGLVVLAARSPGAIDVRITLTSRACPLGELVLSEVRERLASNFPGVDRVNVELVWEPVWGPDLISDRGYELLGRTRARTMI